MKLAKGARVSGARFFDSLALEVLGSVVPCTMSHSCGRVPLEGQGVTRHSWRMPPVPTSGALERPSELCPISGEGYRH